MKMLINIFSKKTLTEDLINCLMRWRFLLEKSKGRHENNINQFGDKVVVILDQKWSLCLFDTLNQSIIIRR